MQQQSFIRLSMVTIVLIGLFGLGTVYAQQSNCAVYEPETSDNCIITFGPTGTTSDLTAYSSGGGPYIITCPDGATFVWRTGSEPDDADQRQVVLDLCAGHMELREELQQEFFPEPPPECYITPVQDSNIRSGPGLEYTPPIGVLRAGEVFTATGSANNWYFGTSESGVEGWVGRISATIEGTCVPSDLYPVDIPPPPEPPQESLFCESVMRLRTDPDPIERNLVQFYWSDAGVPGTYELVIYGELDTVVATFLTAETVKGVNLGEWSIGTEMAWEVRFYNESGGYVCVSDKSDMLFVNADSNAETGTQPILPPESPDIPPPDFDLGCDPEFEEC